MEKDELAEKIEKLILQHHCRGVKKLRSLSYQIIEVVTETVAKELLLEELHEQRKQACGAPAETSGKVPVRPPMGLRVYHGPHGLRGPHQ